MTDKEFQQRLSEVQCLREQSVFDVIMSDTFLKRIGVRLEAQKQLRLASRKAIKSGRLLAHTVDRFMKHTAEEMRDDYLTVVGKTSKRPHAERVYIEQLGNLAYNDTIREMVVAECPDLEEEFNKRTNGRHS